VAFSDSVEIWIKSLHEMNGYETKPLKNLILMFDRWLKEK